MGTLSNLFKSVDRFYKFAWDYRFYSVAQQFEDKTNAILGLAKTMPTPELKEDIKSLAKEYATSVRTGKGQNAVAAIIYMLLDDADLQDEEDPRTEAIKKTLMEVVGNLRQRAGGNLPIDDARKQAPVIEREPESRPIDGGDDDKEVPEPYNQLIELTGEIDNNILAKELNLIAAVYLKAVKIGGGYNTAFNGIKNFINLDFNEEDEKNLELIERIKDVLTSIQADLINRAGGFKEINRQDTLSQIEQLKAVQYEVFKEQSKNLLEEGMDDAAQRLQQNEQEEGVLLERNEKPEAGEGPTEEDYERLQKDVGGDFLEKPTDEDEEGKEGEEPEFTDGLAREDFGGTPDNQKGRGYGQVTIKAPKDWAKIYRDESLVFQAYIYSLSDTKGMDLERAKKNKLLAIKYDRLAKISDKLSTLTIERNRLSEQLSTEENSDPEQVKKLDALVREIDALKAQRIQLQKPVRLFNTELATADLAEKAKTMTDEIEKMVAELKVHRNLAVIGRDKGRGKTNKIRNEIIVLLGMKPKPGSATYEQALGFWLNKMNKLKEDLQQAKAEEKGVYNVRVEEAEVIREKKKSGDIDGKIILFRQQIASAKKNIRVKIIKSLIKKLLDMEDQQFGDIKKQIVQAIMDKNSSLVQDLSNRLKIEVELYANSIADESNEMKAYVAMATELYAYRDHVKQLNDSGLISPPIPEEIKPSIQAVIDEGKTLVAKYNRVSSIGSVISSINVINDMVSKILGV